MLLEHAARLKKLAAKAGEPLLTTWRRLTDACYYSGWNGKEFLSSLKNILIDLEIDLIRTVLKTKKFNQYHQSILL